MTPDKQTEKPAAAWKKRYRQLPPLGRVLAVICAPLAILIMVPCTAIILLAKGTGNAVHVIFGIDP